jgi:hypothetical protein
VDPLTRVTTQFASEPKALCPCPVQGLLLGISGCSCNSEKGAYETVFRACCSGDAEWLAEVLQERQQGVSGLLTRAIISGQPGAVEMLLRAGVDIGNEPELDGWSALTYAAASVDCRILGVLLSHENTRSVLDHRDKDGCTALWWANCLGRREAAGILIQAGADVDLRSFHETRVWKTVSQAGREDFDQMIGVGWPSDAGLACRV